MSDLAEHPFSAENIRRESGAPDAGERAWLKWVRQAEAILGHDLDGNQATDGYSLDGAYDAFCARQSPAAYVTQVRGVAA